MTPDAQRIAIAEACGWTWHGEPEWERTGPYWGKGAAIYQHFPDYINDLNAMHEAEKTLTFMQGQRYDKLISEAHAHEFYVTRDQKRDYEFQFFFIHATAAQRAEAFLRCICKWEEQP